MRDRQPAECREAASQRDALIEMLALRPVPEALGRSAASCARAGVQYGLTPCLSFRNHLRMESYIHPAVADALKEALIRGNERKLEILAGIDMLTEYDVSELTKISVFAVRQERRQGRLLALRGDSDYYRYPKLQFDEFGQAYAVIRRVLAIMSSWQAYSFLRTNNGLIGTGDEELMSQARLRVSSDYG